tara:strand:- start:92 stop:1237 length:1146 start_codon:yes stop_codon:yes gene_type:complete
MPYYKFGPNDIFYNQLETYPKTQFLIHSGNVFYNNVPNISGAHVSSIGDVPTGHINLYELNVDRQAGQKIYPFVVKNGTLSSFKTVTTTAFNATGFGDVEEGSYPLSASFYRDVYANGQARPRLSSIKNALSGYEIYSQEFQAINSYKNLVTGALNFISIPSIFYGSSIQKGTVDLRFYVSGTLLAQAQDLNKDGVLIESNPSGTPASGSSVGLVLYNEGIVLLTASADLSNGLWVEGYNNGVDAAPSWMYFGTTGSATNRVVSSSFDISFNGVSYVPTMTMLAHAEKGILNYSNNPTFKTFGMATGSVSSSFFYKEAEVPMKNINTSSYSGYSELHDNVTYISSIGIYDESMNLIGIAKMANPVRKREVDDYMFKLKLDI